MKDINDIARLIESSSHEIETKMLKINFPNLNDLKALFTPELVNIGFILIDNTVTVHLKNPDFRDFFNDWTKTFLDKIDVNDSSEILIEKFNKEIKAIVLLGQK